MSDPLSQFAAEQTPGTPATPYVRPQAGGLSPGTPASILQPTVPIMGGVKQTSSSEISAWTGGQPKPDWTGLKDSKAIPKSPNQYRSTNLGTAQKSHNYRTAGTSNLSFKSSDDLEVFQEKLQRHFEDCGLDTITYVTDPLDKSTTISILRYHSRLTLSMVQGAMAQQSQLYDEYDTTNDAEAITYLYNSLSHSLAKQLRHASKRSDDPFPVVFARLIKLVSPLTIDRFDSIRARIKGYKVDEFEGQDITKLAAKFADDAVFLEEAGQYRHETTLDMLDIFLTAGGPHNDTYRFPLNTTRAKLVTKLADIQHMAQVDQDTEMAQAELTFRDICSTAIDSYQGQLARKNWPPAGSNPDSKAAPKAFQATAPTSDNKGIVQLLLNLLEQTASPGRKMSNGKRDKSNDKCNNCGQLGHWSNDCPKPKSRNGKSPRDASRRSQRAGPQRGRGTRPNRAQGNWNWKKVKPSEGESQTKTVDGSTYHWCDKCGRWSPSHGTSGHTGGPPAPSASVAASTIFPDPGIWNLDLDMRPTSVWSLVSTGFQLILPVLVPFCLGLLVSWVIASLSSDLQLWSLPTLVGATYMAAPTALLFLDRVLATPFFPVVPTKVPRWYTRKGRAQRKIRHRLHRHVTDTMKREQRPLRRVNAVDARNLAIANMEISQLKDKNRRISEVLRRLISAQRGLTSTRANGRLVSHATPRPQKFKPRQRNRKNKPLRAPPGFTLPQFRLLATPSRLIDDLSLYDHCLPDHLTSTAADLQAYAAQQQGGPQGGPQETTNRWDRATTLGRFAGNLGQAIKSVFVAQAQTNQAIGKESHYNVIWDSGASVSISPSKHDFVGCVKPAPAGLTLQGIAKGLRVEGIGTIAWSFLDTEGMLRTIKVKALYVPATKVRLLSTAGLLDAYPDETLQITRGKLRLSGANATATHTKRNPIEVRIAVSNNLPTSVGYGQDAPGKAYQALAASINTVSNRNANLTDPDKELLRWHYRLGHIGMKRVQFLMRTGVLAHTESARRIQLAASRVNRTPMCTACQYGRQTRRPARGSTNTAAVKDIAGALKKDDLLPGQKVSVDHFVSSIRGRRANTKGREAERFQYSGGCIFVDHASGYIVVVPQVHLNTHETLKSVEALTAIYRDFGVIAQTFLSDNGSAFTSADFQQHLKKFEQVSRFAGVGAHHHNGVAERNIRTVMTIARVMMLHSAVH